MFMLCIICTTSTLSNVKVACQSKVDGKGLIVTVSDSIAFAKIVVLREVYKLTGTVYETPET
jgi:hypothetical protein